MRIRIWWFFVLVLLPGWNGPAQASERDLASVASRQCGK